MGKYRKYDEYHRIVNDIEQKQCQDCLSWFDMTLENFGLVTNNPDKFNHRCKECQKKHQKEQYEYYKINGISNGIVKKRKHFDNIYIIDDNVTAIYIENTKGEKFETIIDTEDLQLLKDLDLFWHIRYAPDNQSYYAKSGERYIDDNGFKKGRSIYLHIEIMKKYTDLTGKHVDHINHNTLDNRKENLRVIEQNNNLKHRKGANSNNKSGYRNVCWIEKEHCYWVQLQINGKNQRLKKFGVNQLQEAVKFAEEMRLKYYGEYAGNG